MTTFKRLLDDPSADLDRVLLESGLDEEPPARSVDKTLAALGIGSAVALGAASTTAVGGAATGVAGKAAAGSWFGLSIAKLAGGVAIATVAIGGGYALTHSSGDTTNDPAAAAQIAPRESETATDDVARLADLQGRHRATIDSEDSQADAVANDPTTKTGQSPRRIRPDLATARPSLPEGRAPATQSQSSTEHEPSGPNTLGTEVALIDQARAAQAAGNYDACLARLDTYQRRFPKGQLLQDVAKTRAKCTEKKSAAKP